MGKSGAFDDALASFAMCYADRTQIDYDKLAKSKRGPLDRLLLMWWTAPAPGDELP
jgi:hypothetical protein